jgi:hypothetical protein
MKIEGPAFNKDRKGILLPNGQKEGCCSCQSFASPAFSKVDGLLTTKVWGSELGPDIGLFADFVGSNTIELSVSLDGDYFGTI